MTDQLNEHHSTAIANYMRFARYQRSQSLRSVDVCFRDIKELRLDEVTYTQDEVSDVLFDLQKTVKSEIESELLNMAHMNALLLQQLCTQAQEWHLKLNPDISELENRELLDKIKEFEDKVNSGKIDTITLVKPKLTPMVADGAVGLLQQEMEELNTENEKLRERLRNLEIQTSGILQEKTGLQSELERFRISLVDGTTAAAGDAEELGFKDQQISELKRVISELEAQVKDCSSQDSDLTRSKQNFLKVKEELDTIKKELDKKFNQTSAYENMRKMIAKKNDQIKELRRSLSKFQPDEETED